MSSQSTSVQVLKVAVLPLVLPCSGPVTYSGDISITGKPLFFSSVMYRRMGKLYHGVFWKDVENHEIP
jgi:hypothetical protein